ncbi:hypothetical protein F8271_16790 [Micromonospora sp. ALFpr18c]|uniref:DUF6077 domain-containing protein n=1 Tax=unclassified Micromonospora TaxID=2617518 RepID=UPI00124B039A|nr:DUF6077 domain-containing protein [Micromonospora sp. ALFpr18c]KAB1939856.1 hypothetical protein F8271_16790 [Micromonospora sp. ALFpr18c]
MTEVQDVVEAPAPADRGTPTAPGGRRSGSGALVRRVNAAVAALPVVLTDAAIVSFALWTLLYHLNLALDLRPSVVLAAWAVAMVITVAVGWRLRSRRRAGEPIPTTGAETADESPEASPAAVGRATLLRRYVLPIGAATGAALLAALGTDQLTWWLAIALGVVAIVSVWTSLRVRGATTGFGVTVGGSPATAGAVTTSVQGYVVLAVSLAAAYFATLLARVSLDDVFYVGKSVWVAERDEIPFRDFLFTEGVLPGGTANPPIPSFEVFIGALARVLHVHAASVTWYLMLPLLAVFVIFALWRLVLRWAPRRPLLVFGVALAYILLVAGAPDVLNTYHLPRLTQGKSVFVHGLVPLAWVYLTDFLENRSRRALALLALLSVAAVGLTTTAVILLPLLAATVAAVLLLLRRPREAVLCFAAAAAYPLLSGVLTRLTTNGLDNVIATYTEVQEPRAVYEFSLWLGVLGVIAGVAMWSSPLLLRRGAPRLLSASAVLTVTLLLVPGVLVVGAELTGLAAVLWRVPWILPVPLFVGLLATIRLPRRPRLAWPNRALAFAIPVALVLAFFNLGEPMWTANVLQDKPSWRMPDTRKNVTFWITRQDLPDGLVLAPTSVMRAMPQVTTRTRVVMARDLYLTDYGMDTPFAKDRLLLGRFADGVEPMPSVAEVDAALRRVDVAAVCLWRTNKVGNDAAPALGLVRVASRKSPGGMICYRTTTSGPAASGG